MKISTFLDYYILLAIAHQRPRFGNRPQERVVQKARDMLAVVAPPLAKTLRDYLFLVAFGEARNKAHQFGGYSYAEIKKGTRYKAYENAVHFDPQSCLPELEKIFREGQWGGSFGGKNWASVARGAMEYYRGDDVYFIDHVASIAHNGGLAYDKPEALEKTNLFTDMSFAALMTWYETVKNHDILRIATWADDDPENNRYSHNGNEPRADTTLLWLKYISTTARTLWKSYLISWGYEDDLDLLEAYIAEQRMKHYRSIEEKIEPSPITYGSKTLQQRIDWPTWKDEKDPDDDDEEPEPAPDPILATAVYNKHLGPYLDAVSDLDNIREEDK